MFDYFSRFSVSTNRVSTKPGKSGNNVEFFRALGKIRKFLKVRKLLRNTDLYHPLLVKKKLF